MTLHKSLKNCGTGTKRGRQTNGTWQSLDTDPQTCGKLTFDKSAKWKFSGESIAFSKIVAKTTGYPCGKIKTLIYTLHRLLILMQKDLNINPKSIQLLEEYIPENLCDFGLSS